ncbi:MAG: hypothetical protein HYZ75_15970 [Elusimicrobia bacterium]|nr:hypothetical protein [Elusimicrobiota bacterium]
MMLRCALIQTANAYPAMPARLEDLAQLKPKLEELRRCNAAHNLGLAAEAKGMGARVVCLGQLFAAPYFASSPDPLWLALAEDALKGPTVKEVCRAAYENALIVVAPLYELDAGSRYDAAVVVDERGVVLGRVRRARVRAEEKTLFSSGAPEPRVFETSAGRIGVVLGYDRHYDAATRALARAGADVIFAPAAESGGKARRLWEPESLADAARHRVFIGAANRRGAEKPFAAEYFGLSHFAGPDGLKLANLSQHPELVVSDLDVEALRRPDPSGWDLRRDDVPYV